MPIPHEIANQRFGRLIALEKTKNLAGKTVWRCLCDCGAEGLYQASHLVKGNIVSCGCLKRERALSGAIPGLKTREDLTGKKFGKLQVSKFSFVKQNCAHWECICECGATRFVASNKLTSGHTASCGCSRAESITRHGYAAKNASTYKIWVQLRQRCENPNDKRYKDYGRRGIQVCDRWSTFENFLSDMGVRPIGMSINRIDNDGNYCPENCEWATQKTQARNQRRNLLLTINEETHCAAEWAEILNINYWRLRNAIRKYGDSQHRVLAAAGVLQQ